MRTRSRLRIGLGILGAVVLTAGVLIFYWHTWLLSHPPHPVPVSPAASPPPEQLASAYEVIVVSGEPEGIAAAVSAARNGARTLLLSERETLGGLMTVGMLNLIDLDRGRWGRLTTRGIFLEFYRGVRGSPFDIRRAVQVFERMVAREKLLTVVRPVRDVVPLTEGNRVAGLRFRYHDQTLAVAASRVIDATPDADVAAAAGAPHTFGRNDYGGQGTMAATLMMHFAGVDWNRLRQAAREGTFGRARFIGDHAYGFGRLFGAYRPVHPEMRLRGLNISRQSDGTVVINGLLIYGLDPLSRPAVEQAYARARAETVHVLAFLRRHFPGFENARIAGYPEMLYIRESRHILGEYVLDIADVIENRDFPDRVAIGTYPVDIQAGSPAEYGLVVGDPVQYSIPFRCLVPLKVENLLVVGRAASFSSLAAGSARVIPVGMATGQAAGVAAAYSLRHGIGFREIAREPEGPHIRAIQQTLVSQGAYLKAFSLKPAFTRHPAYPAAREVMRLGLVSAGYRNNFDFDRPVTHLEFANLFTSALERARNLGRLPALQQVRYPLSVPEQPLTAREAARMVLWITGSAAAAERAWPLALDKRLVPRELIDRPDSSLTRADLYLWIDHALRHFRREPLNGESTVPAGADG
ncbi:MAG: FAD-dependent oxidoreductase [Clostridia bacterium]|nr:FAD-dependent oxidoreductase [Clostridia bacterium]MDH7573569.1 FAD-dependent oxidoreductase [Clostridia bacterium]